MASVTNRKQSLRIQSPQWDDTFQLINWWKVDDVRNGKVMVVGAGALGNEVLKNLALLNVGNIIIVDFDTVEFSNLSRSILFRPSDCHGNRLKSEVVSERIREINPNIRLKTITGDILIDVGLGVFRRVDVVIGCLDNRLARLYLNRYCYRMNKTWIDGAIENLAGQLNVYTPYKACYECSLSKADWNNIENKIGCPDVAKRNYSAGRIPTTPITASIIGAMQTQEALKIINGNNDHSMAGERFYYEGMNNVTLLYDALPLNEDCLSHEIYDHIVEAKDLSCNSTIAETLKWIQNYFEAENVAFRLEHDLILEITPQHSGRKTEIVISKLHFSDEIMSQFQSEPDEIIYFTEETNVIDTQFTKQDLTLKDIGIPPLHILEVYANDNVHYVELTGDESFFTFL